MATIDSLLVTLGYDYDDDALNEFQSDLNGAVDLFKKFALAAAAGAAATFAFTNAVTASTDEQGKFANSVGVSIDELSALEGVAQSSGDSVDGLRNGLRGLAEAAGQAAIGEGPVQAFARLGIAVRDANGEIRPTSQLLREVSRSFQGFDKATQIDLAKQLGLDSALLTLQAGPRAIDEMRRSFEEIGVTTAEDAAISAEFQDSLLNIRRIGEQLARVFTRVLAPALTEIQDAFTKWWIANRAIIEQNIPIWIDRVTRALKFLIIAGSAWLSLKLAASFGRFILSVRALTVGMLALNAAAIALPALIAIGIGAFLLLLEDVKTFQEGGDSLIGRLLEDFPKLKGVINPVVNVLSVFVDLIGKAVEGVGMLLGLIPEISVDNLKEVGSNLADIAKEAGRGIGENITLGFTDAFENVRSFFSNPFSGGSPIAQNTTNNRGATNNRYDVNINVSGAQSPQATATEIQSKLQQEQQNVSGNARL